MKQGTEVKLTKIETASETTNYDPGYWTQGLLLFDVKIGESVFINRYKRADPQNNNEPIDIYGFFRTSVVNKIEGDLIYTKNSVWKLEEIVANKLEIVK